MKDTCLSSQGFLVSDRKKKKKRAEFKQPNLRVQIPGTKTKFPTKACEGKVMFQALWKS